MVSIEELERLSTKELHERAFSLARNHLDAGFFWKLLEAVPAAEAAAGHLDEAQVDVLSLARRVQDLVNPDTTEEADAFRPIYIEYLLEREED
ncbi:MAG: hypothetical protein M3277_09690 [Actinomycetota bacterium]|nr:hypothetical protein [Actinomycetota bacterium]